ncbi:phosphoribosylanthranilate isomerase [Devosia sp. WQ 349]|uniref:phosphoribosylanthranilate isomerase n=1 Tax=Devosia sp. WQ 349K1 TaxID=2800329 RepID=UPI00190527AC|nr:phosphoribosylanthranilate isomerase [Devosia sp. WQ 349K1]MBK1795115.1 phosphoribosylanthranilate isomerase [Devosia sp. WQ 349K1]
MADNQTIKICGIKTEDLLDAAIDAGADMVGFVHFSRSPRHVTIEQLGNLISAARGRVESCVLLVNPDNSCVAEVAALGPDWIQLHGPESPARVSAIRHLAGVEIMKALPIGSAEDVAQIALFNDVADRILVDAKPPKGADRPGGLGHVFDWSLLAGIDPNIPLMLSGGLTADNVAEAIKTVRPSFGIDVSSGVESAPGVKQKHLMEAFVRAARSAM